MQWSKYNEIVSYIIHLCSKWMDDSIVVSGLYGSDRFFTRLFMIWNMFILSFFFITGTPFTGEIIMFNGVIQ